MKQIDAAIELILQPVEHDLGGFSVRRALPDSRRRKIGPWVFFDHMGPAVFAPGQGVDVRPHPHINLATVTYLFEGEMQHRDSLGNMALIRPGEVNLMVAGKGIVHSERQREEIKASGNRLEGLQLWLALPESSEETEPAFHHYPSETIPAVDVDGVPVRVLIGTAFGVTSPVKTFARTVYLEASLKAGQQLAIPATQDEQGIYILVGEVTLNETELKPYSLSVIKPGNAVQVSAVSDARIAIVGGEKLSDRYIWWNFVSSRKARIEQAKQDWKAGRFPHIPGDDKEFIPLPDD